MTAGQGRIGFAGKRGRIWVVLASWLIPALMTGAYIVLIATSEVDATGAAWESVGLAFVLVLWFLFRVLTEGAAMGRAVAIGDADRVLELADFQLARRRSARGKAPFHVYRALALEIRGDWAGAVAELDRASPRGASRTLAATIRTSALVELGRTTEAREVFDAELGKRPMPRDFQLAILSRLAEARLRAAEGDRTGAAQLLARLADDIRAGSGIRERARSLAAQLS